MPMNLTLLFPQCETLRLDAVTRDAGRVVISVTATAAHAACPLCHQASWRVHSHYERRVADLPCSGQPVTLRVRARRFVCASAACPRRIFTERLPALVAPRARQSYGVQRALAEIGYAAGGEGGARVATTLGLPGSPATVLRLVRATPLPAVGEPRVVGIDDWCWRKGQRYGTLICDLESGRRLALLPERTADAVAAWLRAYPSIEVISRDRGGIYADGARRGAPQARQVADRWHLAKNLGEAVAQVLLQERAALAAACPPPEIEPSPRDTCVPQGPDGEPATAGQTAQQERQGEVLALHAHGVSIRTMSRQVALSRNTVRSYLRKGTPAGSAPRPRRRSLLDAYRGYLEQRWQEGEHNGATLLREIRAQGYQGGRSILVAFLTARRRETHPGHLPSSDRPLRRRTPREVTGLFLRVPDHGTSADHAYLDRACAASPRIAAVAGFAAAFMEMLRTRTGDRLDGWITDVLASPLGDLHGFAQGLQQDHAAVYAALTETWSNGPTEGHVNFLKVAKKAMYGRAKLDLLQQRTLRVA